MLKDDLPFLDITASGFSTRGAQVLAARDKAWCARTPYGLAVLRHSEAGQLLRDRRLRQGSHNWPDLQALEGSFAQFWKRSIISQEGAVHKRLRRIAQAALSEEYVLSLRADFRAVAQDLVEGSRGRATIEFIADFSEPFAGRAITRLLGLGDEMAAQVGHDASRLGLAMGIGSKQHENVFNAACDRLMALAAELVDRANARKDGDNYVARLVRECGTHGMDDPQALLDLIVISIFGGVDTTRAQLGFAMALFIENAHQWQMLRADVTLIGAAIEEIIRTHPTTTWSTRQATETFELNGVQIDAGQILHIFVHATGSDPLADGDGGFDIAARRKIHFGFGGGAHHCLGQFVARTDMAEALAVLAQNWRAMEWAGTPEWLPDSGNTSPVALPIRPEWG